MKKFWNKIKLCYNLFRSSYYTVFANHCFATSSDTTVSPISITPKAYYIKEMSDGSFDVVGILSWVTSDLVSHELHINIVNFKGDNAGACCDTLIGELNEGVFPSEGDRSEQKWPTNYIMYVND